AAQQLSGLEEKIRIARPPVALVSAGEGLVDQDPSRAQRRDEMRKERAVKVICNHHAVELPGRKRPRPALDVRRTKLGADDAGERRERPLVAAHSDRRVAERREMTQVPSAAASDVEHAAARADRTGPADYPGRRRLGTMRTRLHIASIIPVHERN